MNKIFNPKVTIVIPVYNGSNYMKEAIDSAINQTYKNLEVIVVNDGSNDNGETDKIAKSYGNKIRYLKKENGGVSSALNLAITKMTGEYFSWLSHDDVYYNNKIERQIEILSKMDYKKVVLFGNYETINKKSQLIEKRILNHKLLTKKPEYALLRGNINGITLLIPKSGFDDYGLFEEHLRCTQDYDMWNKLSKSYLFVHIPEILTKTRVHPEQDTNTHPNVLKEGNSLWIKMMTGISNDRMIYLEKSESNFFYEMYLFLKSTPYLEAMEYAKKRSGNVSFRKKISFQISNAFKTILRIINNIKYYGLGKTLKKVKKKIFKK